MLSNNPIYRSEICNYNDEATTVNENETDTNYENITIVNWGIKYISRNCEADTVTLRTSF